MLKDVSDAGVGILRGGIARCHEFLLSGGRNGDVCGVVSRRIPSGVLYMWRFLSRGFLAGSRSGKSVRFGIRFICTREYIFYRGGTRGQRFDRYDLGGLRVCRDGKTLCGLWACDVKVVHGEPPGAARLVKAGDDGASSGARSQEIARALGVAHRGGKADTPRIDARHGGEALDEAECLTTTIATQ